MIDDGAAVLARVERGGLVEAVHAGHAIARAADGSERVRVGDPDVAFLPRSSLKPLQAVAMLRAGLGIDGEALALACASHAGEPGHVEGVRAILAAARLTPDDLQTPPSIPDNPDAAFAWRAAGGGPEPIAHMCSGKHAAMLATCMLRGWDPTSYRSPAHPLQQAITSVIAELTGDDPLPLVVDGCGAPAFSATVTGMARAYARIATAPNGTTEHRVATAMRTQPWFVSGTDTLVTRLMLAVPGLLAKNGAEGGFTAAMPDGRALAVKILDGSPRSIPALVAALLRALDVDAPPPEPVLGGGRPVGVVVPAF
ncbi:MAG: asparaginase [Pseudonocardiales bacterium]|nr:asparaginase [Pseudonocardiales bacterium]